MDIKMEGDGLWRMHLVMGGEDEVELIEPAVKGTLNVLNACLEAKVKRVVVLSSVSAVFMNADWPKGQVKDESCWSVPECIETTKNQWEAFEFGKKTELEIVTVCPSVILGSILQPTMNASSWVLAKVLQGGFESFGYNYWTLVDVRDVAEAVLLVYKNSEGGERYVCTAQTIGIKDLVDNYLRIAYPNYNYPHNLTHAEEEEEKLNSDKLQRLVWNYRPLEDTFIDSIES
ncbi:cinnamoyl-CoA reductase 1-like [Pyrus ussuriensis x Pyrus communis]|uniref:Cinnamoyl-CoA reductase 1-like n=1 Tax=Pyrus ussuriensis x Pyrus communis TaxID=2448454 RepID=A0A5N5I8Z8_9ROSA|nr:cinnamoyl-CoA reductase 1-like [Pyrus ussuriensis x Pyrus communis]